MENKLETFYEMVEDLDTAMMTTRRIGRASPFACHGEPETRLGADLWFVAAEDSAKVADLKHDPHINLSYYRNSNREWVSVSRHGESSPTIGTKIRELYQPDWKTLVCRGTATAATGPRMIQGWC